MRSCYGHVASHTMIAGPWNEVWYNGTPLKVQLFMWTAVLLKIFTMDSLWRRGFFLPSICLMCYQDAESVSHLLIDCPFAWEILSGISRDFGMPIIAPSDLKGLLLSWRLSSFCAFGKRVWRVVPVAVCWAVWRERNNRVFTDHSEPAWQVYRRAKDLVIFWARRCKGYEGVPNGDLLHNWERVIGISEF